MEVRRNFSKGIPYHTQRNNERIPLRTCNSTAYVMAGKQAGWYFESVPAGVQDEDYLTSLMLDRESVDFVQNHMPEWAQQYPLNRLNELHEVMAQAFNRMLKKKGVATFHTGVSVEEIARALSEHKGVVVSGVFETAEGKIDHVVSLAGYTLSEETSSIRRDQILGFIMDDPYGDYTSKYKNHQGNDIDIPVAEFVSQMKERHSEFKWAHIIEPL